MAMINSIKTWMKNKHLNVPDEWIQECLQWLQSQENYSSAEQVRNAVYEQWLVSDLRELATRCIPEGDLKRPFSTIQGYFPLQMISVIDVSKSCYSQLTKLQGVDNENASVTAKPIETNPYEKDGSRMLKLEMTDGISTVKAIEYKPIPSLSVLLSPGTKIMIKGVISCHLGVLLLKNENVEVLGGEVEALIPHYNQENVLQRVLGNTSDDNNNSSRPIHIIRSNNNNNNEHNLATRPVQPSVISNLQRNHLSEITSTRNLSSAPLPTVVAKRTLSSNVSPNNEYIDLTDNFEDDFVFDEADFESLDKLEKEQEKKSILKSDENSTKSSKPSTYVRPLQLPLNSPAVSSVSSSPTSLEIKNRSSLANAPNIKNNSTGHYFSGDDDDDFDFSTSDFLLPMVKENVCVSGSSSNSLNGPGDLGAPFKSISNIGSSNTSSINKSVKNGTCESPFRERIESAPSNKLLDSNRVKRVKREQLWDEPFGYIYQILKEKEGDPFIFRVKAFVMTLMTKLEHSKNGWKLHVLINDGTASMSVQLTNAVLEELLELTSSEVIAIKSRMRYTHGDTTLSQHVKMCQQKLINMCCLMDLEVHPMNHLMTSVVKISPLNDEISIMLRKRKNSFA